MTALLISSRYVDAQGRLTPEGYALFADLLRRLAELEARVTALETP